MNRKAYVTVVTRNYLAYAKALAKQIAEIEPDVAFHAVIADRLPGDERIPGGMDVTFGDELEVPDWNRFSFQYTPFELSCALKPFAISHVMKKGFDKVVYLDGDMGLFDKLDVVWQSLESNSIVLTPHLLRPLPLDGKRPHESVFLYSGPFNAGFLAVKRSEVGLEFLAWWSQMLLKHCHVDMAAAQFVDQKWLGMVPGMFDEVKILKHFGVNAGHWTLSQAKFSHDKSVKSEVRINGIPLILFHFSGMTPNKPNEYLSSQERTSLEALPHLKKLVNAFHKRVESEGHAKCDAWGCDFSTLNDGTVIHPGWREAIRRNEALFSKVVNPFDVKSITTLKEKYQSIEGKSYKWRRDWRLKWPKEQGTTGQVRKLTHKLRDTLRLVKARFRAA